MKPVAATNHPMRWVRRMLREALAELGETPRAKARQHLAVSPLGGGGGVPSSLPLPVSSHEDPGGTSEPTGQVLIVGDSKRARTIGGFIAVMQARGLSLPFDPAVIPPDVLGRMVPSGQSAVIAPDGTLLGMKPTPEIIADATLGVGAHVNMRRRENHETTAEGGQVTVEGQAYDVGRTFLKSPIMLDLDGDGELGTTGVSTAKTRVDGVVGRTVQFDIDGDGDLDATEWMDGRGDGMLVDDTDGRASAGQVDGTNLFGDQGGRYANGYDKLARKDIDGDGVLRGAELDGLKAWVDDGDAKVEAGELKTHAEIGITEIGVRMHEEGNARGETLMRSTFLRDGEVHVTEDVWFAGR